jgi:hypothetical protein
MLIYLFNNFSLSAIHENMEFCKSHPKKTAAATTTTSD